MKTFGLLVVSVLLCPFATSIIEGRRQEPTQVELNTMQGKVFRSDTYETISNAYILLQSASAPSKHFDLRTDKNGNYRFTDIPVGKYTVSIYAWFLKMHDVPCQKSPDARTADNGCVSVVWQQKSTAYMETVIFKDFSVESGHGMAKDFDLVCK